MKKINILVGIVFFMLVIIGAASLGTDTPNTILQENSVEDSQDASGIVMGTSEHYPVSIGDDPADIEIFEPQPWPFNHINFVIPPDAIADVDVWISEVYPIGGFDNFTAYFNYTMWPVTPNVYTDQETYCLYETIIYGIENTLNYDIGGVSVSIEKMVTCRWEPISATYYMPLLIEPGGVYESSWDQKGAYGLQVEPGWFRVSICYGFSTGYAYFTIDDCFHFIIPPDDFPVTVGYVEYGGELPPVITLP